MKLHRYLIILGALLLSMLCLVSCGEDTRHTYERDAWFSEESLSNCNLPDMPKPAEGVSFVKEDDSAIYLNLTRREYIAYLESLYSVVQAQEFDFVGALKEDGATPRKQPMKMANLFYEFFIGESGENEEFCILFGNNAPDDKGIVDAAFVRVQWTENATERADADFLYNMKVSVGRTTDNAKTKYILPKYNITCDGIKDYTGPSSAYEGEDIYIHVGYTYTNGNDPRWWPFVNQKRINCSHSYQGTSLIGTYRFGLHFSMPGEDITISWTGGDEDFVGSSTTFDRVGTWINGLEADDIVSLGSSSSLLPSGQPFPVASVRRVDDQTVISRILEAWKKTIVTRTYTGHGLLDGGYSSSIAFQLTDGTSHGIQVCDKELISREWDGYGICLKVEEFHTYTKEEMESYCCFNPYNLFGYQNGSITLEVLENGEWVVKKTLLETEEARTALLAIRMQMVTDEDESPSEPLYRIDNQTGFYIYAFSDSLIGVEIDSGYYWYYEIESGGTTSDLFAFLMNQTD